MTHPMQYVLFWSYPLDTRLMSNITTYREIVYELKEKQGKYYCVIFKNEKGEALFKTGYFSSTLRAVSKAKKYIDDYCDYKESKEGE
jgi:hypothetical protein